jgi:hypothetical protein
MRLLRKHKIYLFTCLVTGIAACILSFTKSSEIEISNGLINARLYLPDADNGYYRGVRFDKAGIIANLTYNGHSYFGQWFNDYNPTKDDAVMGPVESFDPIDYDEAKPGSSFIKIGVGVLTKPDDSVYRFSKLYTVVNPGKWDIKTKTNQVMFTHIVNDTAYSYRYQKTVQLVKDKPILILSHTLKNTGKRTIETSVFDHNFFVMDNQPTGAGLSITFPFNLTGIVNRKSDYVTLQDNRLTFIKELDKRFVSFTDLTNGKGANNYDFKIEDHNTGAAVRITADKPISKMAFWSAAKTLCPEPYINIKVEPGQEFSWTINYEYYTCDIIKNN